MTDEVAEPTETAAPTTTAELERPAEPDALAAYQARVQTFFAELQRAMNAPAYGHHAKALYGALLIQAQAAGLYRPEGTP